MAVDEQGSAASDGWTRRLSRGIAKLRMDRLGAQAVRFAISGIVVSIVYIAVTTLLAEALDLPFEIAMAIGWCAGVSVHFTLQRTFVWAREQRFALSIGHQVPRYLLISVAQFGLTAASTAVLPSALGLPVEPVYLVSALTFTSVNFIVFRTGIFHAGARDVSSI